MYASLPSSLPPSRVGISVCLLVCGCHCIHAKDHRTWWIRGSFVFWVSFVFVFTLFRGRVSPVVSAASLCTSSWVQQELPGNSPVSLPPGYKSAESPDMCPCTWFFYGFQGLNSGHPGVHSIHFYPWSHLFNPHGSYCNLFYL